jgi:chromosome segregation ATPase
MPIISDPEPSFKERRKAQARKDWGGLRPTPREVVPEVTAVVAAAVVAATRGSSLGSAVFYGLLTAVVVLAVWTAGSYALSFCVRAPQQVLAADLERLTEKASTLTQQRNDAKEQFAAARTALEATNGELVGLEKRVQELEQVTNTHAQEKDGLVAERDAAAVERDAAQAATGSAQGELAVQRERAHELEQAHQDQAQKLQEAEREIAQLRPIVQKAERLTALSEELRNLYAAHGGGAVRRIGKFIQRDKQEENPNLLRDVLREAEPALKEIADALRPHPELYAEVARFEHQYDRDYPPTPEEIREDLSARLKTIDAIRERIKEEGWRAYPRPPRSQI